nr:MAG TPA: hypothetical protein [Caudoviricetes sp.]
MRSADVFVYCASITTSTENECSQTFCCAT